MTSPDPSHRESAPEDLDKIEYEDFFPAVWRKRLLRVTFWISGVSIAAAIVLWQLYVQAPSPQEICDHKIALTQAATDAKAQAAGGKLITKLRATCVENAERRVRLEGKVEYAKFAKCVSNARSLGETERC